MTVLAFAHYAWHDGRLAFHALGVLALRGEEIAELTFFRSPETLALFGLPETVH